MTVEVGQVRRSLPRWTLSHYVYDAPPFRVAGFTPMGFVRVEGLHGKTMRPMFPADARCCPLWPQEHDAYKDAKGYEVRP